MRKAHSPCLVLVMPFFLLTWANSHSTPRELKNHNLPTTSDIFFVSYFGALGNLAISSGWKMSVVPSSPFLLSVLSILLASALLLPPSSSPPRMSSTSADSPPLLVPGRFLSRFRFLLRFLFLFLLRPPCRCASADAEAAAAARKSRITDSLMFQGFQATVPCNSTVFEPTSQEEAFRSKRMS